MRSGTWYPTPSPMVVIATAGHVDHGKSTLIRQLTGTDPDRWDEERRRGLTIDLGFAEMPLDSGGTVAFVDVPGHARFVKNMVAGVGSVGACLFVVAADEGWKPQSEEHLRILELMGVREGIVVLSKIDRVDADRIERTRLEVIDHLAGTGLENASILAVDAISGRGIHELRAAIDHVALGLGEPPDGGRPRLWIDRSFAISGAGTVVTGTLTGGRLEVGDKMSVVTGHGVLTTRIRGLQSFGRTLTTARPGTRIAVNLGGLRHSDLQRGDALVDIARWHLTRRVDASLEVLASASRAASRRAAFVVHIGADELAVRVELLLGAKAVEPATIGCVRLSLPRLLPLIPGDRYVLRDLSQGETIGGGEILDVDPRLPVSRARPDRSVERVIQENGWIPVDELERLTGEHRAARLGNGVADPGWEQAARARLSNRIDAAGADGLDVAVLDDAERVLLATLQDAHTAHGRIRRTESATLAASLARQILSALDASPFAPPSPDELASHPSILRDLKQQGRVVERDGIVFSSNAVEQAAHLVAELLTSSPSGVSVAEIRAAMGTTRKWAMPLVAILDSQGVTRRKGDLRVAGPRLPAPRK